MSDSTTHTQTLRPHTLADRVASWFRRAATTFIPGWDVLKSDIGMFDVDASWARLEPQIRLLGLDEAHGDVIDRLVEAEHAQFLEHATLQHLSRMKALNRITSQGQWHFIRLQKKVHRERGALARNLQQSREAWLALTGQDQPAAEELAAASFAAPIPIPDWEAPGIPPESRALPEAPATLTAEHQWFTKPLGPGRTSEPHHVALNHSATKE